MRNNLLWAVLSRLSKSEAIPDEAAANAMPPLTRVLLPEDDSPRIDGSKAKCQENLMQPVFAVHFGEHGNGGMHWACGVIDFTKARVSLYDSCSDRGNYERFMTVSEKLF